MKRGKWLFVYDVDDEDEDDEEGVTTTCLVVVVVGIEDLVDGVKDVTSRTIINIPNKATITIGAKWRRILLVVVGNGIVFWDVGLLQMMWLQLCFFGCLLFVTFTRVLFLIFLWELLCLCFFDDDFLLLFGFQEMRLYSTRSCSAAITTMVVSTVAVGIQKNDPFLYAIFLYAVCESQIKDKARQSREGTCAKQNLNICQPHLTSLQNVGGKSKNQCIQFLDWKNERHLW